MSKRRFRRPKLPTEPVTLAITALSHEGRGIAHVDGKVAFVDGALPGEQVVASYIGRRAAFDELRTDAVTLTAPNRVEPRCAFAAVCGGCSLQHMESSAQIAFKQNFLLEQFEHSAKLSRSAFTILPALQADAYHYRRKARLAVRMVQKKGGALVGFREKYSSFITDMDSCQVLLVSVGSLIPALRELIGSLDACYDIPQIEVAVGEVDATDATAFRVALVFRHLQPLSSADERALLDFAELHALDLYLQPSNAESVHRIYPAVGSERLHYHLPDCGLTLAFHPLDFTQVNASINRLIINQALAHLALTETDRVLDLFCGLGNFTLPIATRCAHVVGIEGSEQMVQRGMENAELNGITNAEFYAANLCESLTDKPWAQQAFTKILLDPPRSGAIEIIQQVAAFRAGTIVYISCNPATLARDTAELLTHGYRLKSAGVMDMFPHTTHVESMAVFERID